MNQLSRAIPAFVTLLIFTQLAVGQTTDFEPTPTSVVRCDKAYRYPQAGWIVLHVEGEPHERGVQHGRLMASEIAGYLRCFSLTLNEKHPTEHWWHVRTLVDALFLRKFEKEFLEEMKGIADGASAAGVRFDGRPIDIIDIAALNCWCEIESLASANAATPTGVEELVPRPTPKRFERCSAFAATGPATADGKIVFGHVTMYDLYPANFGNVWTDVQPAKGHRFVMSSFPGGIQSAMDYYVNGAGILISETTLAQTRFNVQGMTCASRIRKAIQYADSIDKAVEFLTRDNNGLYTNEWLLADVKANEIACLQLGTHKHKLWRSSRNEWFGGTPGFYWSCNNHKDMDVRLETLANAKGSPEKIVFRPTARDQAWVKLYEKHRGKIGADFAHEFAASPVLAGSSAFDAKFTTSELAKKLQSWAVFGPPTGKTRTPTSSEKKRFPEIKALERQEWTLLGVTPPAPHADNVRTDKKAAPDVDVVWRGTLLPASDGDIWLALAFADYHAIVAAEKRRAAKGEKSKLQAAFTDLRKQYAAASKSGEPALADVKQTPASDAWYQLAAAKGTLLLHQLRTEVGADVFDKAMDDFGLKHGGQRVSSQQFQQHMEAATGRSLSAFFGYWLREKGLP
jgi:hypothetical protein